MNNLYEAVLSEIDSEIRAHEDALKRLSREESGDWEAGMRGRVSGLANARGILHRKMNELSRDIDHGGRQ